MQTDIGQNELYNALLEWGKSHIMSPQIDTYLEKIAGYCAPFIRDDKLGSMLYCVIKELDDQVNYAISVLSNTALMLSTEDDSIWHEAEDAFYTFDRVNYLMDAIHSLVTPVRKEIAAKTMKQLDEIFSRVTLWLGEGNFSPMRLTGLNDTRRERLSDIPESERYLFPWYEDFAEYKENVLEIIIENFHDYLSKKWDRISREIPEWQLVEMWYEFDRDDHLLATIRGEAVLHKKLLEAFAIPSSLKLLGMTSDESLCADYIIPGVVEDAGIIRVCISLLNDVISQPIGENTKLYWEFLLGFCGPCLDDKQRLELLNSVEGMIKSINIAGATGKEAEVLTTLKRWFQGECEDSQLMEASFNTWLEMMEAKAANMPAIETDETAEKLWGTISTLLTHQERIIDAPPHDYIESTIENLIASGKQVWRIFKSTVGEQPSLYGDVALAAGTSSAMREEQKRELRLENNLIQLSLTPGPEGKYIILPPFKKILKCENEEDYRNLLKYLERPKKDYWGGCFITKDNKPEAVPAEMIRNQILTRKENTYKKAIIGISTATEKVLLDKFIKELYATFSKEKGQLNDSFFTKIVILIISLE